jgi:hypothetical protein
MAETPYYAVDSLLEDISKLRHHKLHINLEMSSGNTTQEAQELQAYFHIYCKALDEKVTLCFLNGC